MVPKKVKLLWGILFLRLGLGFFLALWAINKLIAPNDTVLLFKNYYFIDITTSMATLLGGFQLVLSLFIILGLYKTLSYGAGFLLQIISTLSLFHLLTEPFGKNYFVISFIPILFSFFALFLLREFDTKLCLGKKKSIFS